jgi:hypothetical protein
MKRQPTAILEREDDGHVALGPEFDLAGREILSRKSAQT